MIDASDHQATCPSSSCSPGNLLLGIVRPDGKIAALYPPIAVDQHFVEKASGPGLRPPESRFRFAGPCVTSACRHWLNNRCSLGDAAARAGTRVPADRVPPCTVRTSCRWWSQSGVAACRICPTIVHTPTRTNQPPSQDEGPKSFSPAMEILQITTKSSENKVNP